MQNALFDWFESVEEKNKKQNGSGSKQKKKPYANFEWRKPWLHESGKIWIHIGYGTWKLFDKDSRRVVLKLQYMRESYSEHLFKTEEERLRTYLVTSIDW